MLIVTRQKLFSLSVNTLQLDDTTVPLSDSAKGLGVLLDSTLSMENFISQTAKSCYYQLCRISSVRKYLSTEATVKLASSLILSRLDYCNRRSSEIQGTALGKCLRVRVGTFCWGYRGKDGQIQVKEAEKALEMPVKHCLWGTCSSDSRFPQFCEGVRFVAFAKPTRTIETFLRWSKACGRPHSQSNVSKIISSFFITRSGRNFAHERSA